VEALLDLLMLLFTQCKTTWLTAVSSHCLAALGYLPRRMSAFNSHMLQNTYDRNLRWTFNDLLPCCCYAIQTNRRTIRSQVSQRPSTSKMSELQSHHCITPGQRTWLLCCVSIIPANKLLLQELNKIIGFKLLALGFLEILGS